MIQRPQQRVDDLPTDGDAVPAARRTRYHVITELGHTVGNMNRIRIAATRKSTAIEVRSSTLPEELVGQHTTAWLGYEAGKLIQQLTKGTLRATEAWTDGRHAAEDKYVELDCELAVAPATVTECAARSTVLQVTQVEPSPRFGGAEMAG